MDQFTKLVSGRLKTQLAPGPHPAPELLSAFAENALPEADRGPLLQHLGACSDCREILYLALPEIPELQKVMVPQPRPFGRWGLGWGALVASVAVLAIFFTNRLEYRNQTSAKVAIAPAAAPESETKIAADTTPAELDQIQAKRDADRAKVSTNLTTEPKPQPEAKHMTAKLQPELVFEDSGEVRLRNQQKSPDALARKDENTGAQGSSGAAAPAASAGNQEAYSYAKTAPSARRTDQPAAPSQRAASQADSIGDSNSAQGYVSVAPQKATVPIEGRNTANIQLASPVSGSAQPAIVSTNGALISAAGGNLGGVISDSSGAVVSNAKVTMVGPAGAKTVISDSAGKFSFDKLTPGFYTIKAEANGFKAAEVRQVAVLDNKTATIPMTLAPGDASEVVEVTGAASEVESSNALVAGPQQTAQLSMQKATAARLKRQEVGGAIGSGAGAPTLTWTLSPEGTVQRSGDGGKTWQPVSVSTGSGPFRALSAVGVNIWVGGKTGTLYHSSDFGQNWAKVAPVASGKNLDQDILHLDFSDAMTGTVKTANGEVWTTSDGGRTWQRK